MFIYLWFFHGPANEQKKALKIVKGELNPKTKFVLFERTLKITE